MNSLYNFFKNKVFDSGKKKPAIVAQPMPVEKSNGILTITDSKPLPSDSDLPTTMLEEDQLLEVEPEAFKNILHVINRTNALAKNDAIEDKIGFISKQYQLLLMSYVDNENFPLIEECLRIRLLNDLNNANTLPEPYKNEQAQGLVESPADIETDADANIDSTAEKKFMEKVKELIETENSFNKQIKLLKLTLDQLIDNDKPNADKYRKVKGDLETLVVIYDKFLNELNKINDPNLSNKEKITILTNIDCEIMTQHIDALWKYNNHREQNADPVINKLSKIKKCKVRMKEALAKAAKIQNITGEELANCMGTKAPISPLLTITGQRVGKIPLLFGDIMKLGRKVPSMTSILSGVQAIEDYLKKIMAYNNNKANIARIVQDFDQTAQQIQDQRADQSSHSPQA